jgi:murein DD-endopeptidase MepM/ murein hydrolase activator NlpD
MQFNRSIKAASIILLAFCLLGAPLRAFAVSVVDELRSRIENRSSDIKQIEQEIKQYEEQVSKASKEAQTLKGAIKVLDSSKKKVSAEINLTEKNIETAEETIARLSAELSEREALIIVQTEALAEAVRNMRTSDDTSLIETVLSKQTFTDVWNDAESLNTFQGAVRENLIGLKELQVRLAEDKTESEKKKQELAAYQRELDGRKRAAEYAAKEKIVLLTQTQNKEAEYKKLLNEKLAKKRAFEEELKQIESQLKLAVDPSKLPSVSGSVLSWPLDTVKITQYFGTTPFSTANPQVYNGNGHNGIDLGTPTGTKVKAAAAGVVEGAGDTDKVCAGASYGRWVLVKHASGISTLYAHLSVISVSAGQTVAAGETIGFSGNTGYSTGPHLHFAVFANDGMKVGTYKSKACGGTYTMPLADTKAYLNPLSYLPAR